MDILSITGNLMDNIESGLYDDFIADELQKEEEKSIRGYNAEYMDWLVKKTKTESGSFFDVDEHSEEENDNVELMSALYYFMKDKLGFEEKQEKGKYDFDNSYIHFKYRRKIYKFSRITTDDSIIFGISVDDECKKAELISF